MSETRYTGFRVDESVYSRVVVTEHSFVVAGSFIA
jgi:hypothetical protein